MSLDLLALLKPSYRAQYRGKENKEVKRKGGKTTSKNGQV